MNILNEVKQVIAEILDIAGDEVLPETYLIRDLGAESIDLLELAVSFNAVFQTEIKDDDIFLRKLRFYLEEAKESEVDVFSYIVGKYPFLTEFRIREILNELEGGPVLKVEDLVRYIQYHHDFI